MEQYTDNQYDDDLTIGAEEFGDTFQTSDVDLFEFGGDEESPISRLKTLVLSIDWEITDDVLLQFNEELLDLKDIWADDQVRMVYLQALEKINRYIYRDKSDAHPNAIKLLLGMYYNLEKIVSSEDLSEREIKRLLVKDVRKFEKLKAQISESAGVAKGAPREGKTDDFPPPPPPPVPAADQEDHELIELKALVLGIDWEITEKDLLELREEVMRLEEKYADSKPKLVFLQGIGTLGTYILKKKSNAHADAFTLLHSFYDGLEKIVRTPMSFEEEKAILFPEVEKFNDFKTIIAPTIASDARELSEEDEEGPEYSGTGDVTPAFADMSEEETHGFQEEEEAASLAAEAPIQVDEHINKFFGEEEDQAVPPVEKPGGDFTTGSVENEAEALSDAFFGNGEAAEQPTIEIDRETALRGVDVETEADDEAGEEALPEFDGQVAPALADSFDKSSFSADELEKVASKEEVSDEISGKLDSFFVDVEGGDSGEEKQPDKEDVFEVPADVALQGVDVETEEDEEEKGAPALAAEPFGGEEPESAFAATDDTEADEAPVAALFDAAFGEAAEDVAGEAVSEEPAPAFADIEEEEVLAFDDTLSEGGLLDDEAALEESLDEALAAPVDEEEIASAFAGHDEDQPAAEEFQSVPAALAHLDDSAEVEETAGETVSETEEAEVAEQFDALFGGEEQVEPEPVTGDVFETAADDESLDEVDDQVDQFFEQAEAEGEAEEEEQVTFTLEEEAPEAEEVSVAGETEPAADEVIEELGVELSEDDILAAIPEEEVDEPFAALSGEDVEVVDEIEPTPALAEDEEYAAVFTAADVPEDITAEEAGDLALEEIVKAGDLESLTGCVQSLALDLDDSVVQGLFAEINSLRQQWTEKNLEKSYLQLLSTVAQHIDQYRYEASAESHELLANLVSNLELSREMGGEKAQELLLADTYQILQWQQNMLSRQAVSRGGQLTFLDPVRSDTEDVEAQASVELSDDTFADDFTAELESAMTEEAETEQEDAKEVFVDSLDDEIDTFVPEGDDTVDLDLEEALNMEVEQAQRSLAGAGAEDGAVTEIVRQEIDSLRKVLQEEIAELRNAIKGASQ